MMRTIPGAIFLDTSVFAGQQYNFLSTAFRTFVDAYKTQRSIELLLPDPTEREIKRQMNARATEALHRLNDARKMAPFLAHWPEFKDESSRATADWAVERAVTVAVNGFLEPFIVRRLDYRYLDMVTLMNWYDRAVAPFREGKKRKEFPDAMAVAMIDSYAEHSSRHVAVVSEDPDFKAACERFAKLLHFQTLPRLTELLLSADSRLEKLQKALHAGVDTIASAVQDELPALSFYQNEAGLELDRTDIGKARVSELAIVALGDGECTFTFEADFEVKHHWVWEERGPEGESGYGRGDTAEDVIVEGTGKAVFSADSTELKAVTSVSLDNGEWEIGAFPYARW